MTTQIGEHERADLQGFLEMTPQSVIEPKGDLGATGLKIFVDASVFLPAQGTLCSARDLNASHVNVLFNDFIYRVATIRSLSAAGLVYTTPFQKQRMLSLADDIFHRPTHAYHHLIVACRASNQIVQGMIDVSQQSLLSNHHSMTANYALRLQSLSDCIARGSFTDQPSELPHCVSFRNEAYHLFASALMSGVNTPTWLISNNAGVQLLAEIVSQKLSSRLPAYAGLWLLHDRLSDTL